MKHGMLLLVTMNNDELIGNGKQNTNGNEPARKMRHNLNPPYLILI